MGWFYILVRTFPFWAIPISLMIFLSYFKKKTRPKGFWSGGLLFIATALAILSVFFLFKRGQFTAVPFFHELVTGIRSAPR